MKQKYPGDHAIFNQFGWQEISTTSHPKNYFHVTEIILVVIILAVILYNC